MVEDIWLSANKAVKCSSPGKMDEKYAKSREMFKTSFISDLQTELKDTQIVIVSLGTGYSSAKQNNRKALELVVKGIIEEDSKNNNGNSALLCFKRSLDSLRYNKYGEKREDKLERVVYNFLNTRGRYISILKNPEPILQHTKQIVLFVPRKIKHYLKLISPLVTFKHFVILRNCKLLELHLDKAIPLPVKVIKRRESDGQLEAFDKCSSSLKE